MNKRINKKQEADSSGFTLIETIVYIAIVSMIAVALVSLAFALSQEDQTTTNGVIHAYENDQP